jgi:hypothetical protein
MPTLQPFIDREPAVRPNEIGAEAFARAGRSEGQLAAQSGRIIGDAISEAGRAGGQIEAMAQQHQLQQDVLNTTVARTTAFSTALDNWNSSISSDNSTDPQLLRQQAIDGLRDSLDKAGAVAQTDAGRAHAAERAAETIDHFAAVTAAGVSTKVGQQTISKLDQLTNQSATTAYNNPSSAQFLIAQAGQFAQDHTATAGLEPGMAAQIQGEHTRVGQTAIALAAAHGAVAQGQDADSAIRGLSQYLNTEQQQQVRNYAAVMTHAQAEQVKAQAEQVRKNGEDQANSSAAQITASLVSPDGSISVGNNPSAARQFASLAANPYTPQHLVESGLNLVRSLNEEAQKGLKDVANPDANAYLSLTQRLSPDAQNPLSIAEINQARADGKINNGQYTFLKGAQEAASRDPVAADRFRQTNTVLKAFGPSVDDSSIMAVSPQGRQNLLGFTQEVHARVEAGVKAGVPLNDLLSVSSPKFVIDPGLLNKWKSATFQLQLPGTPATLSPNIEQSRSEASAGVTAGNKALLGGPPKLRLPGETAEAFIARTGQ